LLELSGVWVWVWVWALMVWVLLKVDLKLFGVLMKVDLTSLLGLGVVALFQPHLGT
jgi:hypothetical protein